VGEFFREMIHMSCCLHGLCMQEQWGDTGVYCSMLAYSGMVEFLRVQSRVGDNCDCFEGVWARGLIGVHEHTKNRSSWARDRLPLGCRTQA
jgi:hypothetical protein